MNIDNYKKMSLEKIRSEYREYLQKTNIEKATVATRCADSFYLWNNENQELFWNTVLSVDFENNARTTLLDSLNKHSSTNPESSVSSYLSHLRAFREFILSQKAIENDEETDIEILKKFLLDIDDCLFPLLEWTDKFNMFDILKISKAEIRHSNMLAWLLTPNENHGLNDEVIKRFIQYVVTSFSDMEDVFAILLKDYSDFFVLREYRNIDILAISDEAKLILCIENKIGTTEHDNQLLKYRSILEQQYPDYNRLFIYLSPNGDEPSDTEWCSMDYISVLKILEQAKNKRKIGSEAELLIDNYIEVIRREVVEDEKIAQICAEIYKKHKKAIDLIIEHKPDKCYDLAEIFKKWGKEKTENGEIKINIDKCSKTYTRFTTNNMSELLPDANEPLSGWNTTNNYFYEIYNYSGNDFYIQLAVSAKNLSEELKEKCNRMTQILQIKNQKQNWQWRTFKKTSVYKVDEDYTEEKIIQALDKQLKEIKEFEKELTKKLGEKNA